MIQINSVSQNKPTRKVKYPHLLRRSKTNQETGILLVLFVSEYNGIVVNSSNPNRVGGFESFASCLDTVTWEHADDVSITFQNEVEYT